MKNKIITLAVLREARIDENRTPFSPAQISNLLNKYSNLKIIVQPSKRRCFKDKDYLTWVLNLSNLNFNPSYDSSYTPGRIIPIPYATLIYHSFFYKFLGLYSFILLEFFCTFIFLTISSSSIV